MKYAWSASGHLKRRRGEKKEKRKNWPRRTIPESTSAVGPDPKKKKGGKERREREGGTYTVRDRTLYRGKGGGNAVSCNFQSGPYLTDPGSFRSERKERKGEGNRRTHDQRHLHLCSVPKRGDDSIACSTFLTMREGGGKIIKKKKGRELATHLPAPWIAYQREVLAVPPGHSRRTCVKEGGKRRRGKKTTTPQERKISFSFAVVFSGGGGGGREGEGGKGDSTICYQWCKEFFIRVTVPGRREEGKGKDVRAGSSTACFTSEGLEPGFLYLVIRRKEGREGGGEGHTPLAIWMATLMAPAELLSEEREGGRQGTSLSIPFLKGAAKLLCLFGRGEAGRSQFFILSSSVRKKRKRLTIPGEEGRCLPFFSQSKGSTNFYP